MPTSRPITEAVPSSQQLTFLVYELLDAHDDTARLAAELAPDVSWEVQMRWEVHLGYLRDLQRLGREALALSAAGASDDGDLRDVRGSMSGDVPDVRGAGRADHGHQPIKKDST
jgi:hypothetical protein